MCREGVKEGEGEMVFPLDLQEGGGGGGESKAESEGPPKSAQPSSDKEKRRE